MTPLPVLCGGASPPLSPRLPVPSWCLRFVHVPVPLMHGPRPAWGWWCWDPLRAEPCRNPGWSHQALNHGKAVTTRQKGCGKACVGHAALEIPLQAALGNEQALDGSGVGQPGQRLALENQKQGRGARAAGHPALPGTCRLPYPCAVTSVVFFCSCRELFQTWRTQRRS